MLCTLRAAHSLDLLHRVWTRRRFLPRCQGCDDQADIVEVSENFVHVFPRIDKKSKEILIKLFVYKTLGLLVISIGFKKL